MRIAALVVVAAGVLLSMPCAAQEAPGAPTTQPRDGLADLLEGREPTLVAQGFKFTEGPLWLDGKLIFSDIPANTVYEITPGAAPISAEDAGIFRRPSGQANGNTLDNEGRVVSAEHDRQVTRTGKDGQTTVLVREFEGKKLNRPNDLVVKSDGSIYFTDPTFGLKPEEREQGFAGVYRLSPQGELMVLTRQFQLPNGLAFSPDEKRLYVSEFGKAEIWAFDIKADHTLAEGELLASLKTEGLRGGADGLRVDEKGNLWATGPGGVWVVSAAGEKLGRIDLPGVTNVAFGGEDGRTLFITAGQAVYSIRTKVAGARPARPAS